MLGLSTPFDGEESKRVRSNNYQAPWRLFVRAFWGYKLEYTPDKEGIKTPGTNYKWTQRRKVDKEKSKPFWRAS